MGRQIGGSPNTVNVQGTVNTITSQSGSIPATPSITYPTTNLQLADFSPTFTGSAFFTYVGATHSGSNWQIASDSSFNNILYDFATASALTSWAVNNNFTIPRAAQTLYVRVKYVSNGGQVSSFSAGMPFRTDCSVATSIALNGPSNFNLNIVYSGTGSASSFNVKISTNANMSNPVFTGSASASSNSANISIPYTTLPGLVTGTVYYVEVTPAGANAVPKVIVNTLNNPAASVSGTLTSSPVVNLSSSTVTNATATVTGAGSPAPAINIQYSTSTNFSTITYTATSSGGTFSASSLPGLTDRTVPYYSRAVLVIGNDRIQLGSTTPRVGATAVLTSATAGQTGTTAAGYSGAITVYAIGGGGGGGGTYTGAAGGGGSGFVAQANYTLTGPTSFVYTTGAGGGGGYWTDNGATGGTTTFTLSGQSSLTAAGGNGGASWGNGGQGGTGGANGASGGVGPGSTGNRGGGGTGVFALGGLNGEEASVGVTGYGGNNYGAGGGGGQRDPDYGSSSNFAGGGGGGLLYAPGVTGSNGNWGNVTSGGAGARGACAILYIEW